MNEAASVRSAPGRFNGETSLWLNVQSQKAPQLRAGALPRDPQTNEARAGAGGEGGADGLHGAVVAELLGHAGVAPRRVAN